ncbi:MAG: NAD(P)/FAD-dependent oxidoreductase [Verrucomicrobiota bacterium]
MAETRKKVVVLGAGFGGLEFCKKLKREKDVEITLIDRQNHHLFQPLLYQVATAGLSAPEIAQPIRVILAGQKNLRVVMDEVTSIDLDGKAVNSTSSRFDFDYLVIALGATTSYFGKDEWAHHAPGLKSLDDATTIRRRLLLAFEEAAMTEDPTERQRLMTIVVVGGGPTGVEVAGACAELCKNVLNKSFPQLDTSKARVVLVEANEILDAFDTELVRYSEEKLEEMGVEIMKWTYVEGFEHGVVKTTNGDIPAANCIWGAGVQANPVAKSMGIELGPGGRIPVDENCALKDYPHVFAIGDITSCTDAAGNLVPGVAPAAMQMGKHAAKIIRNEIRHGTDCPREGFKYFDKGMMATIGRSAAIAEAGGIQMKGFIAWIAWLFVHLLLLVGLRNRIAVFLQWLYSYVVYRRGARIITGMDEVRRLEARGENPAHPVD